MSQLRNARPVVDLQKPFRSEKYLKWVRQQPCVVTGRPAECAHHIRGHGFGKMGGRPSDYLTMPLVAAYHYEQFPEGIHKLGVEIWEQRYGSQWEHVARTLEKYLLETK